MEDVCFAKQALCLFAATWEKDACNLTANLFVYDALTKLLASLHVLCKVLVVYALLLLTLKSDYG